MRVVMRVSSFSMNLLRLSNILGAYITKNHAEKGMTMEHKHLSTLTKILLIGAEVLFVGILFLMRLGISGWLLIIFGVLLIPILILWAFVHLGLMTAFITVLKSSKRDIALYLAVHFFI